RACPAESRVFDAWVVQTPAPHCGPLAFASIMRPRSKAACWTRNNRMHASSVLAFFALISSAAPAPSKADREALKQALAEVIERTPLKTARTSISVQSLDDGTVVFARNPDDLLNPASNVKLFTAAAC